MGRTGEAITLHLSPSPATSTGILPVHMASAVSGSAAAVVIGTMAGIAGTATQGTTEIGMAAEETGTVPRAEGIQEATAGIDKVSGRAAGCSSASAAGRM